MGRLIHYIVDADRDIDTIFEYILQNYYSESIARSTVQKIIGGIKKLSKIPELGVSLDKKLGRKLNPEVEIRMLILDQYLVFYFVDKDKGEVFVMRVLHAKQDYMRFLHSFQALSAQQSETI